MARVIVSELFGLITRMRGGVYEEVAAEDEAVEALAADTREEAAESTANRSGSGQRL